MKISVVNKQIQAFPADALIVNLFENVTHPGGATGAVDTALGASDGVPGDGAISRLIQLGDFKGKLNEVAVVYSQGFIPATRVIVVGLGNSSEFDLDRVRHASASAVRKARDLGCKRVATIVHGSGIGGLNALEASRATVEGALLGAYQFREHKSNGDDNAKRIDELFLVEYDPRKLDDVSAGAREGEIVANAVNTTRDWVNRAPNVCNPPALANFAQEMARRVGLKCVVLNEKEITEMKMGGVLAVSQGSANPPRFVILEHAGHSSSASSEAPIVLVGKGVTFDTGGISLKARDGMESTKGDMAGAAAVIGAVQAIAELKLPKRVIGLVPMVENMPSDRAYRPSDVITMMNGLTVEIISTDAEGRMILADALHYAKQFKPRGVIDIATLTAQSALAMGEGLAACYHSTDEGWASVVDRAAATSGERIWRMPLWTDYLDRIKSDTADMKNSGGTKGGLGASAIFLKRFVDGKDGYPWAHIDMAGMAFDSETKGTRVRGASGFGVRMLVEVVKG
jgi:leucyl aminopeptidase